MTKRPWKIMWDKYDRIYQAEVDELQRVTDEFLSHVHGCTECTASIDVEDQTITGVLCEVGESGAEILKEHGNWTWEVQETA